MRRKAKHRFLPSLLRLETRLNISVTMNYVGQTNLVDLFGTSSPGPDGFADGEIDLSNLSGTPISSVSLEVSSVNGAPGKAGRRAISQLPTPHLTRAHRSTSPFIMISSMTSVGSIYSRSLTVEARRPYDLKPRQAKSAPPHRVHGQV